MQRLMPQGPGKRTRESLGSSKQQIPAWLSTIVVTLAFHQVKNFNTNWNDPAKIRIRLGLITEGHEHQVETGFTRLRRRGCREVMDDGDAVSIRNVFTWTHHFLSSNPQATHFFICISQFIFLVNT